MFCVVCGGTVKCYHPKKKCKCENYYHTNCIDETFMKRLKDVWETGIDAPTSYFCRTCNYEFRKASTYEKEFKRKHNTGRFKVALYFLLLIQLVYINGYKLLGYLENVPDDFFINLGVFFFLFLNNIFYFCN